jgi:beta-ureidopropionase / N-carbamoyl-L-amino-acid hydrolase
MILPTLPAEMYGHLRVNAERLKTDFDELALIGGTPEGGVNRLALSPEDLRGRAWFAERIETAGLHLHDDDAGNLSAVLYARDPQARTLLIGSHLDSVPNGGRFDGSVGVLAALECLRMLRESGIVLPVHIEAINFTDDEGCWCSLFGSRAIAGMLTDEDIFDLEGDNAPFRAALSRAGIDPRAVFRAERPSSRLIGYLELHIEQGERLERGGVNIGVVTNIVGRTTYEIVFTGQAGHSGTTDMYHRRDALRGAAQFIVRAHDQIRARYGDGVFNCGDIDVKPGKFNIIPSEARLIVECRHANERLMTEMEMLIVQIAREAAAGNGLIVDSQPIARMPVAQMNPQVLEAVTAACDRLGLSHISLISYSGHDAQIISRITPSAMIFIPSQRGISHRPEEFTPWQDVINGANVLLQTVLRLAFVTADGEAGT